MTPQEIEYNKRSAELQGAEYEPRTKRYIFDKELLDSKYALRKSKRHHEEQMCFHSDWNWIIEVIEAIENIKVKEQYIYYIQLRGATCEIKCSNQYSLAFNVEMPCIYEIAKSKKEAVIQAINKFLIWYNNEKSNK